VNGRRHVLGAGFRALAQGRLILLLTVATVLLGASAAVPLWPALETSLGGTLAGDHILRNHATFAPTDVLEFLHEKSEAVHAAMSAAHWSMLLGVFIQVFFAGGIVAVVGRPMAFDWIEFFSAARRNFWHNVKCLLVFAVLVAVAVGLGLVGAFALLEKIFAGKPPGEAWLFQCAALGIALLFFGILSLLYDVARAARRQQPSIGTWRAWAAARRALSGAWMRAIGLFFFWLVVGGVCVLGLAALEWSGTSTTAAAVAVHTVLQVSVLAARSAVRLGAWGSYLELVDERLPAGP
jgi:hypothetical protein